MNSAPARLASAKAAALAVIFLGLSTAEAQDARPPAGFRALFDGKSLAGWWGADTEDPRGWMALAPEALAAKKAASQSDIAQHWRAEGGELVNDGAGLFLTSEELFGDFELRVEYKTVAGADSGIYLRGLPQVQIWDTTEAGGKWNLGADKGSGGLWNNSPGASGKDPLAHVDRPFGERNAFRIVMVGERVSVWLNGALVVDHARLENYFDRSLPAPRRGPIQLQTHGGEIRWRNVHVRDIGVDEANAILCAGGVEREPAHEGWETIFDGKSFVGWSGLTGSYEVRGGAIVCRAGEAATIYTDAEYGDFVAELEIAIPPGGNNGLAIRYPGEGDPAYAGMCELQVLDDDAPKYASLDPRQFHGSVYGQIAAQRGYLRAPGEWNFERVTVQGSRVTVELNGTRILDGDLATVAEFLHDPAQYTGRARPSGHFGLAGHGDPVGFRNLRIRRLGKG